MKFKIRISELIAKILLKQRSLDQTRHCLNVTDQIWHHFLSENIEVFS